jgi:hypothetical protein
MERNPPVTGILVAVAQSSNLVLKGSQENFFKSMCDTLLIQDADT